MTVASRPIPAARRTAATSAALLTALGTCTLLSGCGLAETGAATAAGAQSEIDAAKNAKATEDEFKRRLDAAQDAAAAQRTHADESSGSGSGSDAQ